MVSRDIAGVRRPARWDVPLGADMSDADVDRVFRHPPFDRIDARAFPSTLPLEGIVKNDARLRRFDEGDIIVRQGDYGNTAFYVMEGTARVVLADENNQLPSSILGRSPSAKKKLWDALAQLWRNPKIPELRNVATESDRIVGQRLSEHERDVRIFLQDVPGVLERHKTATLNPGEFFGEIAALGRTPRTATIFAESACTLLEIRWQGLRDIRRRSIEIKEHIDRLYRENSLRAQLRSTSLFRHLDDATLARVADRTLFETYGEFDWFATYQSLANGTTEERLAQEPIIVEQGDYPNGVTLIRSGFARLSQRYSHGERTLRYLGKGQVFGADSIVANWRDGGARPFDASLRAMGYVDTLLVPSAVLEELVFPELPQERMPTAAGRAAPPAPATVPQGLLEFLGDNRFINGTAAMAIDLDRCTRCDDCVAACAATHDNNPRFIRHGPRYGSLMIANACMHCADPVCMIGCPTGAIHRDEDHGQVLINDRTCIGCSTCANSCPYDNIRMVEARRPDGDVLCDTETELPILKATKCDLCIEQRTEPACQSACSQDALRRVNFQDAEALEVWGAWLNRS